MLNHMRKYGVAILMIVVASHQLYRVQLQGQSSWRGGGFGMYASFHPRHHDAWVHHLDSDEFVRYQKYDDSSQPEFLAVRPVLTWPTDEQLARAMENLPESDREKLEAHIYRLEFDVPSCVLSRKLLASWPQEPSATGDSE